MTPQESCLSELSFNIIGSDLMDNKHAIHIYILSNYETNVILMRWIVLRHNINQYPREVKHKSPKRISIHTFII